MRKSFILFTFIFLMIGSAFAQTDQIKASFYSGEITAIREADNKINLNTKDGAIEIILNAKTGYKKVLPENPSPSAAVASSLSEMSIGDKVLVSGFLTADKTKVTARTVFLMTKSDISKKLQTEQEKWKKGVTGKVILINEPLKEITVSVTSPQGNKNVVVSPKPNVVFRRYAPDSVKFSDAKISEFKELKVGDQLRAAGDRNEDGSMFKADEIVSGNFRTLVGKITAIDIEKKEITIKDLKEQTSVITIGDATLLKKYPEEFAQMAMMQMMGGMSQGQGGGTSTVRPPQQGQPQPPKPPTTTPNNGNPTATTPPASRGMQIDDNVFERFPTVALTELKVGDAIAISATNSNVINKFTAMKLISGLDFIFNVPQITAMGRGRGGSGGADLNIPGLDGFGSP
ncbi:MAG: hypothetical protein MUC29_04365 [Pyrinomonadaceae bacterium]|nr:hypothetical protein [Pyrinomonadaceae bacterium]